MRINVLFVEDLADDVEIVVHELERAGYEVSARQVETEPDFRQALESGAWDLIVSDYSMPRFTGVRAFEIFGEKERDTPFIFVSGALGEERAVEAMRRGARDYFIKGDLGRLAAAVRREIDESKNRRARLEAERRLEAQLRQAQKMEAVGQLAGGVAHDFNNILTAIITFTRFAREAVGEGTQAWEDLGEVLRASDRAAALTRQLLAFSRRQPVIPAIVDVNGVVTELVKMLSRLLREDVELRLHLGDDVARVYVDPGALEQVLVNLAVNARDAMPAGGTLALETRNATLDDAYEQAHATRIPRGDYVVIAVSDTGTGMTEEVRARAFEPFFTTKGPGRGTGLGLSTCYGIVKQAKGFIWAYSEVGRGTTFKVYLPVAEGREPPPAARSTPRSLYTGSETVLVVEDDDQVRGLVSRILASKGYHVLSASDGDQAIEVARSTEGRIHLLLTDVVMPKMSGKDLVEVLRTVKPGMRVLFMSGYTPTNIVEQGLLEAGAELLEKPFALDSLLQRVREVLTR